MGHKLPQGCIAPLVAKVVNWWLNLIKSYLLPRGKHSVSCLEDIYN